MTRTSCEQASMQASKQDFWRVHIVLLTTILVRHDEVGPLLLLPSQFSGIRG
jgi:hypothetical protein